MKYAPQGQIDVVVLAEARQGDDEKPGWPSCSIRILLGESVPGRFGALLVGHSAVTVQRRGWASIQNGKLLALAAIVLKTLRWPCQPSWQPSQNCHRELCAKLLPNPARAMAWYSSAHRSGSSVATSGVVGVLGLRYGSALKEIPACLSNESGPVTLTATTTT